MDVSHLKTKREKIIALAKHGYPPSKIAPLVGTTSARASQVLAVERKTDPGIPRFATSTPRPNSNRQMIIRLGLQGLRPGEISAMLGIRRNIVYSRLREARADGYPIPSWNSAYKAKSSSTIYLDRYMHGEFQAHADKRGITVPKLVKAMLRAIAEDQLVDGIMDDQETQDELGKTPAVPALQPG